MKSSKMGWVLLLVGLGACGKSDDKKTSTVEEAPNVCKALAVMGTFPVNGQANVETYGVACFEGYLIKLDQKWYQAPLKCGEAQAAVAQGDEMAKKFYQPLAGKTCPTADTLAVCDMGTAKTLVYKESEDFFKKDAFESYCTENHGTTQFL